MRYYQNFKRLFGDMCVMVVAALLLSVSLVSCDEHEPVDLGIHPGHILLADGNVVNKDEYFSRGDSTAVGIIFSEMIDNEYYLAVMLNELPPLQFCDSLLGMVQGTSCDITALDGRTNTIALWNSFDNKTFHGSPLANAAYSAHEYGMSDFIPSVAEMKMLYAQRGTVNSIIERLNKQDARYAAVPLSTDRATDDCWYWTSTEVKDNQALQAWLFSLNSGTAHETGKEKVHHARKVYVYNPYKSN